ncbi:MAG: helix-turn-helix transcriptional regulator [Bdellovibrionota bacterium]|nr:helix-turn-helix transcriptional regulator [Bdellovibrionota bacterium]
MEEKIVVGISDEAIFLFKKKLEAILEARDMSLAALAKECGVPSSTLHDIIAVGSKVGNKSIHYLEAVCEFLNTDLESMIRTYPQNEKAVLYYNTLENSSFKKLPEKIQNLKKTCREISLERMKYHFDSEDVEDKEVLFKEEKDQGKIFSFILGDLNYAKLNIKTIFDRKEISSFVSSKENIDDFMKECSNVAMGGIKKIFEADGTLINTSLPLIMREKDSVFLEIEASDETRVVRDRWSIEINGIKIICEIFFEVYNQQRFFSAIGRDINRNENVDQVFIF